MVHHMGTNLVLQVMFHLLAHLLVHFQDHLLVHHFYGVLLCFSRSNVFFLCLLSGSSLHFIFWFHLWFKFQFRFWQVLSFLLKFKLLSCSLLLMMFSATSLSQFLLLGRASFMFPSEVVTDVQYTVHYLCNIPYTTCMTNYTLLVQYTVHYLVDPSSTGDKGDCTNIVLPGSQYRSSQYHQQYRILCNNRLPIQVKLRSTIIEQPMTNKIKTNK